MNKQSSNLSEISATLEQKIKYKFKFSYFRKIKNLINVNKKTSRASDKVKLIYTSFIEGSFIVGTIIPIASLAIASAIYMRENINAGSVFLLISVLAVGWVGWARGVNADIFDSTPLDTKTLKDLKYYITCSVKENDSLDFDYDLIDYHLKMVNENTGEYAVADLKEIFLHIQDVVNNQKITSYKKQEVLSLINNGDTTKLNDPLLNIKNALENKNSLYLNK